MYGNESDVVERPALIQGDRIVLHADLTVPRSARGIVLFAHGSGSSRKSPRNRAVAAELQRNRLATLLLDLLAAEEEGVDDVTRHLRFDIALLAERLVTATEWVRRDPQTRTLPIGYFGASTGAAAALVAAAQLGDLVSAVVSRGGRPDLAAASLTKVRSPTLLLVGGFDEPVMCFNRDALAQLPGEKHLEIIPRATHLFEEPGAMAQVTQHASRWFERFLAERHAPASLA